MITRNRLRTALAELQQQGKEQQGTQSTTEVKVPADELVPQPPQKPPQSSSKVQKPTPSAELQSADALAHIAKKLNFISLDRCGITGDDIKDCGCSVPLSLNPEELNFGFTQIGQSLASLQ